MKYTILIPALAVFAPFTIAGQSGLRVYQNSNGGQNNKGHGEGNNEDSPLVVINGTFAPELNVTNVVVMTYNITDTEVCPLLVDHTYQEIYHNDHLVTADGGACVCWKYGRYWVACNFVYCSRCFNGICVRRQDIYDFGSKYSKRQVQPVSYEREFLFLYEKVPFHVTNKQGWIIDEGNWTHVKINSNRTSCLVTAVDDMDEETTMCTCEEVTCGNTTQYAYNCGGRKWGNCNSTLDNFDPDVMDIDDPLFVLNTNYLDWSDCFDEQ